METQWLPSAGRSQYFLVHDSKLYRKKCGGNYTRYSFFTFGEIVILDQQPDELKMTIRLRALMTPNHMISRYQNAIVRLTMKIIQLAKD
jgi:hypothetical protein